jgi:hypothetical protein
MREPVRSARPPGTGALALLRGALRGAIPDRGSRSARSGAAVLGNGLTVLTLEDRTTPVVSFVLRASAPTRLVTPTRPPLRA